MMPPAILTRAAQARGETNYRWQSCPHDRTPKAWVRSRLPRREWKSQLSVT